jgi:predicted Zn-dependent protease
MRRSPFFRSTALGTLVLVLSSCASTQLPPISSQGGSFHPLRDERALWGESRQEEEKLLANVELFDDPALESYLDEVVGRLNPRGMAANRDVAYKVRVIADPTLNAFAYPHGSIYVHTGLLARMESEDELATVLGHEMTHVENRHMLRYQRSAHNKEIGITVAAVTAAVVLAVAEDDAASAGHWGKAAVLDALGNLIVPLGLELAFQASVNGYGRGLEIEADEGGFAKLATAGYDPQQAPKVYQVLLDDRGETRRMENFFFGSHPHLSERVENTRRYLAGHPMLVATKRVRPLDEGEAFAHLMWPVVRYDARLNIEAGRLRIAGDELARARALRPDDPETHDLQGRLWLALATGETEPAAQRQLRGEAEDSFLKSIELDPRRPIAHRELGLLLYDRRQYAEACVQLRRYAALAPEAEDVPHVQDQVQEMERDGRCQ